MKSVNPSARGPDPIFTSYAALANGLVGDLTGICLLDGSLEPRGAQGELAGESVAKWIRSLRWSESHHAAPTASECGPHQWWIAIPLEQFDGSLLGVFCVSQSPGKAPAQPSRLAADLALRLKPLLDCVHRDLVNALPVRSQVQTLTERSAELEWLFRVTSNLKAGADDKRILEQLVAEATSRLSSALGVLYVPDKRLMVKSENDPSASAALLEAWHQTREHLITWVHRQNRPLVVNTVGREGKNLSRCKVLCVPVVRESGRVIGALAFYNLPQAANYSHRQVFLARHIGRQAASIVEAQFDLMTGLYTRSGLDQMYSGLGDAADFIESSVIYLDIDHMHVANELHGFELGNELIVRVADLLSTPLLPDDALAARIAGDRFTIVLPSSTSDEAMRIAKTLQMAASKLTIGPSKDAFDVSITCGISALIPMPEGLARAIAAAELACKTAKSHGRNRVELYAVEDGSMMRRHADALAVGQLRSALKADRLLLYAQRITPLQNPGLPGGYEILLRLRDVDGTLVPPGPLIDAAQRYQLLPSVDRWVMQRALQMLTPYRGMLLTRGLAMSINVSGQSIGDETFIQRFTQLLNDANLPRHSISIELTEQAAITNLASAKTMVARLGASGCGFALDDFGTGANSLTYLKALQASRVKIDGSFVRDIQSDRNSKATVKAIVELAKGMGIETVAEYVENQDIAQEVRLLGVDYAQGYAFGKPEPLDGILEGLAFDESRRLHRLFLET
jgi:diguanylate cyclase (GGDEF)-like protein